MLTVMMSTLGSLAASSLKRLVCASQTGVSSDGTTLMIRTLRPVSASVTSFRPLSTSLKSGAFSPGFNAGPINVNGLPFSVVAPGLSIFPPSNECETVIVSTRQTSPVRQLEVYTYSFRTHRLWPFRRGVPSSQSPGSSLPASCARDHPPPASRSCAAQTAHGACATSPRYRVWNAHPLRSEDRRVG